MLSFGTVAYSEDGKELGTFERNLELLPGARQHPDTMAWWADPKRAAAWKACRQNLVTPERAMKEFVAWVKTFTGASPVCVAAPVGFDFMFLYWYMVQFGCESPFSFSALDFKSYASAVLKVPYRQATKRNLPKSWFPKGVPHTHVALDDAREQGLIFLAARRANFTR